MNPTNQQIAKLFREIAAAYTIKKLGNIFQIRAYEGVADAVEHSTSEIKDLWEEGKLDQVPGLGKSLQGYLEELFKSGKVKHFEAVKRGIPDIVFELLDIPGIGPKTAQQIEKLGVKSIEGLEKKLKSGELVKKGFSGKIGEKILLGLSEIKQRTGRILLPYASAQAAKVVDYLKRSKDVIDAHPLGSLRRMAATIGDLDFSACSKNPERVIEYFTKLPGVSRVIGQGENKASVVLRSGLQLDLLVGEPNSYGALLQHFTGSKAHNIKLRTLAQQKGLSLSEYGVRKIGNKAQVTSNKLIETRTEEEFYKLLGMEVPAPELREDTGEIEAALRQAQGKPGGLPNLVELKEIKGDLHTHSNFSIEKPSHGPGVNSIEEMVKKAIELGYQFIGISDHSPSPSLSKEKVLAIIDKRTKFIQQINKSINSVRVLNGLEIDILGDGNLSVPDEALRTLDYCIAGIHSGHRGSKEQITKRLLKALENPYVDIISHPTNRLLNERDSSEADWETIFKYCGKFNKLLEINGYPNRMDLRDDLVRTALKYGVKFVINTDAHKAAQMDNMLFGVSVARRGWATKKDIVNTWDWTDFAKWFKIKNN